MKTKPKPPAKTAGNKNKGNKAEKPKSTAKNGKKAMSY